MPTPAALGNLKARLRRHRTQLGLSFRVTTAALISLTLSQAFNLPWPIWAVLTSVIVSLRGVGRSPKATIDYLSGTLGGAVYGAVIGVLIPHASETSLLAVLAIVVAPLVLVVGRYPNLAAAPITAVIVTLVPAMTHISPLASAADRVLEVALGGITGFVVSLVVLPSNASHLALEAAARTLEQIALSLSALLAGLEQGLDLDALHRLQNHIGQSLVKLETLGKEAERERSIGLSAGPDSRRLHRTLLRLRHDLVIIGRVSLVPLPESFWSRLQAPLAQIDSSFGGYMRASGAALLARGRPVPIDDVENALAAYSTEVALIRAQALTRSLPDDGAERFFALGFALEQMRQEFKLLAECVAERAAPG